MAEILSPGVFIEEVPSAAQVIQGVSTSNMGIVGYAQRGPTDRAVLCTSFEQFTRTFGQLIKDSFLPLSMAAFFANGGRRAFVVRVAPADATKANCQIQSKTTDQSIETGDGTTALFTKTDATSLLKDNSGASPLVRTSVSVRWRAAGAAVPATNSKKRDGTTNLTLVTAQANYEGRIDPTTLPAFDSGLMAVVPLVGAGQATITYALALPLAVSLAFPLPTGGATTSTVTQGAGADTTTATLDFKTGIFSIRTTGTHVPVLADNGVNVQIAFTPATATKTATDSAGTWAGDASGTLTYTDGAYSLNTGANIPHNLSPVLATYKINAWDVNPISVGAWGNSVKLQVSGHPDYFNSATATYSAFNVSVLSLNTSTGNYEVVESYEELDFSTATSAQFFPDVVNELSDLIAVTEPSGEEAPGELAGVARSKVIGGGDQLAAGQTFSTVTLTHGPVAPRTIVISYTDSTGTARTVTDNGTGVLIGDVDGTGTNTIVYASGVLNVKLGYLIQGGTLVTVSYRSAAEETAHTESFGDTAKTYTEGAKVFYEAGTEGTFDSTNWGINQFTADALKSSYKGVYALSKVDELMQVCVPDFAGDKTVTGQLLDYADQREALPHGGDRFIILTVPKGSDPQEAVDWFRYELGRSSKWAALYWPWVKVADPLANNRPLTMPPLAHVAGVYARTDNVRNVGKSPGGTVDGALRYLLGLEYESTQAERDFVYPNKINPLVSSPQTGLAVWGVRTISPTSEWRYINARRLFMFVEKSVFESTHWIVFENNGPGLWTRVKAQLEGFLKNLYNENYFAGSSPAQAFFVICDESNNPPESVANGQVIIDVGIAPNKPAEFVRFRFQQKTSQ